MKRIYTIIKDGLKSLLRKTRIFWVGVLLLVVAFVVIFGATKLYFHYLEPTASFVSDKERIETEDQLRRTVLQILGGVVVLIGLYLTYRRIKASEKQVEAFRKQITVAEDGQITERFTRAVEQLGNENIHIRLGGIYALERLANDSDKDHATVMEILAAFVRERGPVKPTDDATLSDPKPNEFIFLKEDIHAALSVLGRRKIITGEAFPNLNFTYFWRAQLLSLVLPNVSLMRANFREANLLLANLRGSFFVLADLREATLLLADLQGANLYGADLRRAYLRASRLQTANLRGADLREAKNVTVEQLSQVKTLFEAKLDPELENELREKHPHLFDKPQDDKGGDEETE